MEIHKDSIKPKEKVLVVDDLIATGGTAEAGAKLVEKSDGVVSGELCLKSDSLDAFQLNIERKQLSFILMPPLNPWLRLECKLYNCSPNLVILSLNT